MPNETRLFPPFRLDPANAQLWHADEEISLRPKTFEVLRYLVDHPGQLVTKAAPLDAVWPEVSVSDTMPANCVAELRRALNDDAKAPKFIETVHRRGYRFLAKVSTEAIRDAKAIGNTEAIPEVDHAPLRKRTGPKAIVVGRQAELEQIQSWYADVLEGERRVVFVSGEAGIGKTTFVEAFLDSIVQEDGVRLGRGQCLEQYGSGEPYMPVLEALSRLGRERDGGQVVEVLSRFAPTWLAQMPGLLTREERARSQSEIQGVTQQRMLREITEALEALATESPLVLVLEDLHWSDFSTLELISAIARRSEPARLLILATYRPVEILAEGHPLRTIKQELELHRYCEEMRLKPLSEENVADYLVRRFSSDGSHQFDTLAPVIHARTDGNPLFIVNVVDYLLGNAGLAMRKQQVSGLEALVAKGFETPRSIREMIERNLERLKPEEQAVLESASVVGPEFSAASVAAALERPQGEIEACCSRLSRREQFVTARGSVTWPDGTIAAGFRFNHALYQEVLYSRLPAGHQLQLHRLIALREEAGYGERAVEVAAELAYHYSRANDKDKAIEYFRLAGKRAVARGAFKEAEEGYRQALAILKTLSESRDRDVRELELMRPFALVLQLTRGWAAPEAAEAAAHARSLAERVGNLRQLVSQLMSTWTVALALGVSAGAIANELLELAEREGSPASLGAAHTAQVISRYYYGDLNGAEEHFMRGFPLLESAWKIYPGVASNVFGAAAYVAWMRGHVAIARDRSHKSILIARELNNPFEVAYAQLWAAGLHLFIGEHEQAETLAAQSVALSNEQGFPQVTSTARVMLGRAEAGLGRPETGVSQIRQGLSDLVKAGSRSSMTLYLTWLTETLALDGDCSGALATIEEALQANPEELAFRAYAFTVRGELLLKVGQTETAESAFRDAIAQATKIGAKALELRATRSLAWLLDKQDKREEARTMLAAIYNWFTEGFDTADLKKAKALLHALNEKPQHWRC